MDFIIVLIVFFLALTVHEYAHGWVALKRGDPTATYLGRLTLNPLAHIDPIGTIILPLTLLFISRITNAPLIIFGWAKPVPINFRNLNNPKRDMIFVGLAGPLANIILANILAIIAGAFKNFSPAILSLLQLGVLINLFLAIFNLLPVPPLDGSRILMGLLPSKFAYKYAQLEPYGFIIIIALIYLGLINLFIMPLVGFLARFFFQFK